MLFLKNMIFTFRQMKLWRVLGFSFLTVALYILLNARGPGAILGGVLVALFGWLLYISIVSVCSAIYCTVAKVPVAAWSYYEFNALVRKLPRPQQITILTWSILSLLLIVPIVCLIGLCLAALAQALGVSI
jgi:hypothetical protein